MPYFTVSNHKTHSLATANFSLPRPLCSRLTPDVRDRRQTDDRRQTRIIA